MQRRQLGENDITGSRKFPSASRAHRDGIEPTMDEEDFFKDYPAPSGSEPVIIPAAAPAEPTGAIPLEGFVLGGDTADSAAVPADDGEHDIADANGAPESTEPAECAAVTEWRKEFAAGLETKVANERKVKAERAARAHETLSKMHETWTRKCVETEEVNKKNEKEFLRDRDALLARMSTPGEPPAWGVIPELVDMSGKFKEGARDTSRMRQVLLKLKTY